MSVGWIIENELKVKDKRFRKTFMLMEWQCRIARRMHKLAVNHKTWKAFSEKCTVYESNDRDWMENEKKDGE